MILVLTRTSWGLVEYTMVSQISLHRLGSPPSIYPTKKIPTKIFHHGHCFGGTDIEPGVHSNLISVCITCVTCITGVQPQPWILYRESLCAMFVAGISWLGGEGSLQSAAIELLGF